MTRREFDSATRRNYGAPMASDMWARYRRARCLPERYAQFEIWPAMAEPPATQLDLLGQPKRPTPPPMKRRAALQLPLEDPDG